ncbi:hypothetical protein GQF61_15885 [Sphingobacterium sp. DK4209]|uniref:Uncharacterized protein n=1 Tax=Sphingobacterium zhuxiongii TaxID=2662364 RepID=A0A5Q0QAH0_9SPHI|nr:MULTISPECIES: hypothetical protein [unclassified Sphingobacterium]MVZ67336.1 hypothetical protein [Sphingobacterium sp. DK4209]QGA26925.1 hypothetical protein GFH32_11635 [Sphingobacterium sp. dk4302]
MKKIFLEKLIREGYHVLDNGRPKKVEGNIWAYLDDLEEDEDVLVLGDLLTWIDVELSTIKLNA